jgi:DNA polymerase-1
VSLLDHVEVTLVDDVATADEFLTWLSERRSYLAIDTETVGLDWWKPGPFLRLIQFGDANGAYVIPVHRWRGVADIALSRLRDARASTSWLNWKFDAHAIEADGLPLPFLGRVHDVGAMSRLINPLQGHKLKQIGTRIIGPEAGYGEELLKQEFDRTKTGWATIPYDNEIYWGYGGIDPVITAVAVENYAQRVQEMGLYPAYEREMAVQEVMYRAERRGLRVDVDYASRLRDVWRTEAEGLRRLLEAEGIENPNSNIQVETILKEIGWEPDEWTETGQAKLDKVILAELEKVYPKIAAPLIRYKRLTKWIGSYLDKMITEHDADMHIHPSINTSAARTGRMSITGFAAQTLPRGREIRDGIIADEGHALYSMDYDGMEMVALGEFCQDPNLLYALREGEDLHTFCARLAYGDETIDKSDPRRSTAKNTNFSRIYGAGPQKIADTAGVPVSEIKAYMAGFDARFPGVPAFIREVQRAGALRLNQEGEPYIYTTGGRRLPCDPDKVYVLVNYLIQGSCADIFKDAIVRLDQAGYGDNILLPVHDELIFQFPDDDTEGPAEARRLMEDLTSFTVPFTVGSDGPLQRWGEKYA